MKCFYHTDVDGKCAGAIVNMATRNQEQYYSERNFIGIDYKDNFPFKLVKEDEMIYVVDFSLQKEGDFKKLKELTSNIIWIDHHKTAIEKHVAMQNLRGIRDTAKAGCELVWEHFYPNKGMPLAVQYAGRYDVWDFSKFGKTLNEFQAGIKLYEHNPTDDIWKALLFNNSKALNSILNDGKIALKFRTNRYSSLVQAFSFLCNFEGYKAICCNVGATSSQLFDSVEKDFDLMVPFVFDGKRWTVSLYTKKDIDCSEIAKKYGGGGHKKAAGFQCESLPFLKTNKGE